MKKVNARTLVLNEFRNYVWHCHKNAYDADTVKAKYHRVKGILFALWKVGEIDLEYYRTMVGHTDKLYQKPNSSIRGNNPLPNVAVDGHKPV